MHQPLALASAHMEWADDPRLAFRWPNDGSVGDWISSRVSMVRRISEAASGAASASNAKRHATDGTYLGPSGPFFLGWR